MGVFFLKVLYLHTWTIAFNTAAMIVICVFIVIQIIAVRKAKLTIAVFAFSFFAELFNLIYNGKSAMTMLFYFGMHTCLLIYFLIHGAHKKVRLFFELPICTLILFMVYSWGFWRQGGAFVYLAMICYSLLLCVNLTLSCGVNKKTFTGMLLLFLVDTIVVWSLVKGGAEVIRAISWLPFLVGEKCLREGMILAESDIKELVNDVSGDQCIVTFPRK
jgi:ABC-type proline/glycine betaine transport system permease subunit